MRRVADALLRKGYQVSLISGGLFVGKAAYEVIQLPVLKTRPGDFLTLLDDDGRAVDTTWKQQRRELLLGHLDRLQPEVLIVETWPFGRRQLEFEILPMLDHVQGWRVPPLIVSSIRDVLQQRKASRRQETLARIRQYVSLVLVHGDRGLIGLESSFPEASDLSCPLQYSGYIAGDPFRCPVGDAECGDVVVSAGGGGAGTRLLDIAVEAACNQDSMRWRVLAGPRISADNVARWQSRQFGKLVVERNREDFASLLSRCCVSVSQFGYNTAVDLLRAGCPAVVVPYAGDGETEQATRAQRFAQLGMIRHLPESALSPETLGDAVRQMAGRPPSKQTADLGGAERSATILQQFFRTART
jgi:predicted glycosyltransferase